MKTLAILAVLCLMVASPPALAKPPSSPFQGFHVNPVIVDDRFNQPDYSLIAQSVVADLNSVMPSTGPLFVYNLATDTCGKLDFNASMASTPVGHISLCQFNISPDDPDYNPTAASGYGQSVLDGDEIIKGGVYVAGNSGDVTRGIICHELLHAVFESPGQEEHQFMAGDCVNGMYTDVARDLLAQVYGQEEAGKGPPPPKPGFCDAHPDHWKCVGALSPKHHGKHDS